MCVVILVLWQGVVLPGLPPSRWVPDWDREQIVWTGPTLGPFFCGQNLDGCRVVVAGDSRVRAGILGDDLDREGMGPSALLWGPGALTHELVAGLVDMTPRRLVLGLNVQSISKKQAVAAHLVLREPLPELNTKALPQELAAWTAGWRDVLTARGLTAEQVDLELPRLAHAVGQRALARGASPASIDHRLGVLVDGWRDALVRVVSPSLWREGWMPLAVEQDVVDFYASLLPVTPDLTRMQNLDATGRHLAQLVAAGWEVVCVRMPTSAGLAEVEDGLLPPEAFAEMCAELGVPYLDHQRSAYRTLDAVHLSPEEGRRFSLDLARQLERQLGW